MSREASAGSGRSRSRSICLTFATDYCKAVKVPAKAKFKDCGGVCYEFTFSVCKTGDTQARTTFILHEAVALEHIIFRRMSMSISRRV